MAVLLHCPPTSMGTPRSRAGGSIPTILSSANSLARKGVCLGDHPGSQLGGKVRPDIGMGKPGDHQGPGQKGDLKIVIFF